jgi:E3 ubiquitin-protein ligase RNF14
MSENLVLRREEILALSSIYDELILNSDGLSGSLIIPVELDITIPLVTADREGAVRFLPGIQFTFSTGKDYPESEPPVISLKCSWLSAQIRHLIEDDIRMLWSKELCLFNMIDEISERAKSVFGLEVLEVSNEIFDVIIQFAEQEEATRFNESTYYCEICLENKKGTECFKLLRCGHISCKVSPIGNAC